jgi:hypothetical protein
MKFEKFRETGAMLSTAAALGGLSVSAAEARPLSPVSVEVAYSADKNPHPFAPPGVHVIENSRQIKIEGVKAVESIKKRWNGVIVLHHPKSKDINIAFASSPSSYDLFSTNEGFVSSQDDHAEKVVQPAVLSWNHRVYLAVGDHQSGWGFLDVKWAMQQGALDLYEFTDSEDSKGSAPKPVPYVPMMQGENGMPQIENMDHVPKRSEMIRTIDINHRLRGLKPSKVVPHP